MVEPSGPGDLPVFMEVTTDWISSCEIRASKAEQAEDASLGKLDEVI